MRKLILLWVANTVVKVKSNLTQSRVEKLKAFSSLRAEKICSSRQTSSKRTLSTVSYSSIQMALFKVIILCKMRNVGCFSSVILARRLRTILLKRIANAASISEILVSPTSRETKLRRTFSKLKWSKKLERRSSSTELTIPLSAQVTFLRDLIVIFSEFI